MEGLQTALTGFHMIGPITENVVLIIRCKVGSITDAYVLFGSRPVGDNRGLQNDQCIWAVLQTRGLGFRGLGSGDLGLRGLGVRGLGFQTLSVEL